jgi:hypothetical protein
MKTSEYYTALAKIESFIEKDLHTSMQMKQMSWLFSQKK